MKTKKTLKEIILEDYEKGNISLMTLDGVVTTSLKDFINQPTDSILYDLNRNESAILTEMENNITWINDYACGKVIRALKDRVEELERELKRR